MAARDAMRPTAPCCHAWRMAETDDTVTLPRADLDALLAVADLYLGAFTEDEMMTLPEKLRLQMTEEAAERCRSL